MHIGSGTDLEHLRQVCGAHGAGRARGWRPHRDDQRRRRLPVPYRDGESYVDLAAYFSLWDDVRRRLAESFGHAVRLEIEPGRYLVAESGYLVTEIRAIKQIRQEHVLSGRCRLQQPGPADPVRLVSPDVDRPCQRQGRKPAASRTWWLAAHSASRAIFSRRRKGASSARDHCRPPTVGDFLVLEVAGAYGFVMGSNYNSKPLAPEVLVSAGRRPLDPCAADV